MLRWVMAAALLLALASATPAWAGGLNNLKAGVNGVLTFPADPVMLTVFPPEDLEDMPLFPVTGRIAGLVAGSLQGGYRAFSGATDIVTSLFWILPSYSPGPRYELIPGIETD